MNAYRRAFALGMATASRGACHMRSRASIDVLGLPEQVLEKIYGGAVSNQFSSYRGKGKDGLVARSSECGLRFVRSLPFPERFFEPSRALGYEEFAEFINVATGMRVTPQELKTIGERISSLERSMLVKDGISRRTTRSPAGISRNPSPMALAKGRSSTAISSIRCWISFMASTAGMRTGYRRRNSDETRLDLP